MCSHAECVQRATCAPAPYLGCVSLYTSGVKTARDLPEACRRRDANASRQRILAAARTQFAATGYDRSTIRMIAAAAGVSPNLVTRYFGAKQRLFAEATALELGLEAVLPGPRGTLGQRIATHVVGRWEGQGGDDPLISMVRAAAADEQVAAEVSRFFAQQAARPVLALLDGPDAHDRAALVGAMMLGISMTRYVLRTGPIAAAQPAALVTWLGGVLQTVLDGDLGVGAAGLGTRGTWQHLPSGHAGRVNRPSEPR